MTVSTCAQPSIRISPAVVASTSPDDDDQSDGTRADRADSVSVVAHIQAQQGARMWRCVGAVSVPAIPFSGGVEVAPI
jgi:hypothetical protein